MPQSNELFQTLLSRAASMGPTPQDKILSERTGVRPLGPEDAMGLPMAGTAAKVLPPAIGQLLKLLRAKPEPVSPLKVLASEKATGFLPQPPTVTPPPGFTIPNPTIARDPKLIQRYDVEQNRFRTGAGQKPITGKWGGTVERVRKQGKLNPDLVRQLRADGASGMSYGELEAKYGVSNATAREILSGGSWSWVK